MIKSLMINKYGLEVPVILLFKIHINLCSEDAAFKFLALLRLVEV
jgi:hypothetical protein